MDANHTALTETTRFDLQLGEVRRFRGVDLEVLISDHAAPRDGDLVVLSFANGMRIPLPRAELARVRAFVAFEIEAGGSFQSEFPPIAKKHLVEPDPRPIRFGGNKVVVSTPASTAFTPWAFADSLIAVELVDHRLWESQFPEAIGAAEQHGRQVFLARCQPCHAIGGKGASFGWDFLTPLPLSEVRSPSSLHAHVKYRNLDAAERGYLMPPQSDVQESDTDDLWLWIAGLAAR